MANLNEDVLRCIFDYLDTPLDWVKVSEVCQLWKSAASKQWGKITEIIYDEFDVKKKLNYQFLKNVPVISAEDAQKILLYAAPFVKTLSASVRTSEKKAPIMFGSFVYEILDFNSDAVLKLLAENTTNITKIRFDRQPNLELLKLLIGGNTIKTVELRQSYSFYKDVPTDEIEELKVRFNGGIDWDNMMRPPLNQDVQTFAGHFQNLTKLDISLDSFCNIEQILSNILPHVRGLTSLQVYMVFGNPKISSNSLLDIARFAQLENLSIILYYVHVTSFDSFINKLAEGCPKLQTVELIGERICEAEIVTLLSLPRLESVTLSPILTFPTKELPEMPNLTQLHLRYHHYQANLNIPSFCSALKKMPNLKVLGISRTHNEAAWNDFESFSNIETLQLICGVATVAVSQEKEVLLKHYLSERRRKMLRIARKNTETSGKEMRTLELLMPFRKKKDLFGSIETFVQNNLRSHYVLIEEGEQK